MGDSIMALFPNSADDAVKAAIGLHERLEAFNDDIRGKRFRHISIGVGIHTGNLILGTIGNENRMETTVISDAVNLASRLEDLTKIYEAKIIISRDVFIKLDNPGIN